MENIRSSYNNNKFKISAHTWNDESELPDEYSRLFLSILNNHNEKIDHPSIKIYINKIEDIIYYI